RFCGLAQGPAIPHVPVTLPAEAPQPSPTRHFSHSRGSTRVVFGRGTLRTLRDEIEKLSVERVLVVSTPGRAASAEALRAALGERGGGVAATAREHVPAEVVNDARRVVDETAADCVVAIGGGSAIGLGKALTLGPSPVRLVAIPTTYSGSEMTPIYGITE